MDAQRAMHSARPSIHTVHYTRHKAQGTKHKARCTTHICTTHYCTQPTTHNTHCTPHIAQRMCAATPNADTLLVHPHEHDSVRRTSPPHLPTHPPIQSPHLLHVDHTSSVFGDVVQRELELLLAVTSKRSQHLRGEALVVHADGHAFQVRQAFLEPD